MPLLLSPVTPEDLPGLAEVHYKAFTDSFSLLLFPRTSYSQHAQSFSNHFRRAMEKPSQCIYKVVDASNGKVISFAKWSVACLNDEMAKERVEKARKEAEEREAQNGRVERPSKASEADGNGKIATTEPQRPTAVNMEFGRAFKQKITDVQRKHVGDRKTLFLEVLCTLPEYQGRGAAKMHLRWGEEYARREGIPIWLDASPLGLGLYEKEGFTFVERVETDLEEWGGEGTCVHTCMVKEYGKEGK